MNIQEGLQYFLWDDTLDRDLFDLIKYFGFKLYNDYEQVELVKLKVEDGNKLIIINNKYNYLENDNIFVVAYLVADYIKNSNSKYYYKTFSINNLDFDTYNLAITLFNRATKYKKYDINISKHM